MFLFHPHLGGSSCRSTHLIARGGTGGAAIRLVCGDRLSLEGVVEASSGAGDIGGSGGSGGSLWLDASYIYGRGRLLANGGKVVAKSCLVPCRKTCCRICTSGMLIH